MIENSAQGLTLLDPDHEVTVTKEEQHQPALLAYAPRGDGRARRVAVELCSFPITRGTHAGQRGIEVRLDGRRVGELTFRMAQRYGPIVQEILRRGGRPGCVALVDHGRRGLEVELRLPEAPAGFTPAPRPPGPPARRPAPRSPQPGGPSAGRPRRSRTPYWVGGGVLGLLLLVGVTVNGGETTTPTSATAAAGQSTTTTARSASPSAAEVIAAEVTTASPAPTTTPSAQPSPQPVPRATPRPEPAPQRAAVPEPEPAPQPEPEPASDCDPNYSGCVPIASDVDCEGGSGNGPAYVRGPVRVTGDDIYGLDRDGDGTGCDS